MRGQTFTILTINRPLKGQCMWYGTARSARRRYEWFAEPDRNYLSIQVERGKGFWMILRRSSKRVYRRPVLQAIAQKRQYLNENKRRLARGKTLFRIEVEQGITSAQRNLRLFRAHWARPNVAKACHVGTCLIL